MNPKTAPIGQLIDAEYRMREKRLEAAKKVEELKKKENYLKEVIISRLGDMDLSKASGEIATAGIKRWKLPTIEDIQKVKRWVFRHKDIEIFERRLHRGHIEEVLNDNPRGIPGVGFIDKVDLNLSKSKK